MKRLPLILFVVVVAVVAAVADVSRDLNVYLRHGDVMRVVSFRADSVGRIDYCHRTPPPDTVVTERVVTDTVISMTVVGDSLVADTTYSYIEVSDTTLMPHVVLEPDSYDSMVLSGSGGERIAVFPLDSVETLNATPVIPVISIDTDSALDEIQSKTEYVTATIAMDGGALTPSLAPTVVNIRGRGNSTWAYPKKPYRLKFPKKVSLGGLAKAKSYALIANYIDESMMRNALAFKIAELLEIPFSPHCVPVEVVLNGRPRGLYMLTEKIGMNGASVDIPDSTGVLMELDTHFDETYQFISPKYSLPVMIKDPDPEDLGVDSAEFVGRWMEDFNAMEIKVSKGLWYQEVDARSFADYMLTFLICGNREVSHPKSIYMYKSHPDSLYRMGPVWDFDWAFTFSPDSVAPFSPETLLMARYNLGDIFFGTLIKTRKFREVCRERWIYFRDHLQPQLWEYFDEYSALIRAAALRNGELWPTSVVSREHPGNLSTETFDRNIAELREWLRRRIAFIDSRSAAYFGIY